MIVYLKKTLNFIFWILDKVSRKRFKKIYPKYLRWLGVNIDIGDLDRTWINPNVFLDSSKYELITIGKGVTISFGVTILCHDYSIKHAFRAFSETEPSLKSIIYKPVEISDNCFIGAKAIILPGTTIGDNVIVGAGSVVKGNLEKNSIYAGNPARKIGSIESYTEKQIDLLR